MELQSWNRFKTSSLTVEPALLGCSITFAHAGSPVSIKLPSLDRVGDRFDERALASPGAENARTGEVLHYYVHAVDVTTDCQAEVALPEVVLQRTPNAFDHIEASMQDRLNAISGKASANASSAFEYWIGLVRWLTGFHRIGRELRVGNDSGWGTYLQDRATAKPVWRPGMTVSIARAEVVTANHWQKVQLHAASGEDPPMHLTLLADAKHCIDLGDYRRALVDLSIACEVYLRTTVLNALPEGVLAEAIRLIEEANINQFVTHMFPALLSDLARTAYQKSIKKDLDSLFAKRNKLMHVAVVAGADSQACERYRAALESLFALELRIAT